MDIDINQQDDVLNPFYYFVIAFSVLHLLVTSVLFVRQRDKFPVSGHNIGLTLFIAVAITAVTVAGATAGITDADTCTVATPVIYLAGLTSFNMIAAQALRLWFEYNLAEEQGQNMQADIGEVEEAGWYTRKRSHFQPARLIGIAVGVSLVEVIVAVGIIASLDNAGFATPFECDELLVVMVVIFLFCAMTCAFIIFIFRRFGNRSDGFGLKTSFKWWAAVFLSIGPVLVLIEVWEAFTDLEYYVEAIRVSLRFIAVQLLVYATLDRPIYQSFHDASHGAMSSISQDHGDGDDDDLERPVEQVMELANTRDDGADVELQSPAADSNANSQPIAAGQNSPVDSPNANKLTEEAPEVFSSATLSLSIEDILLKPLYVPQLESFTKHLVGEFSVESLLFFYRVLSFKQFAKSRVKGAARKSKEKAELSISVQSEELSQFSDSGDEAQTAASSARDQDDQDDGSDVVIEDAPRKSGAVPTDYADLELAWRALLVYREFLDRMSFAQINISHRVSLEVRKQLEESIVHFEHLSAAVALDDLELKRPVPATIFDRAQQSVLLLLERDPFVRWRRAIREVVDKKQDAHEV